jgi:hypothetical protein
MVPLEPKDLKVLLGLKAPLEPMVIKETMGIQEFKVQPVPQEPLDTMAPLDLKDQLDHKDLMA